MIYQRRITEDNLHLRARSLHARCIARMRGVTWISGFTRDMPQCVRKRQDAIAWWCGDVAWQSARLAVIFAMRMGGASWSDPPLALPEHTHHLHRPLHARGNRCAEMVA